MRLVGRLDASAMMGVPRVAADANFFMKQFHVRKGHHDAVAANGCEMPHSRHASSYKKM
jgi:hypothetical protein